MAMTENEIKVIIAAEIRKAGFYKARKQTDLLDKQFKKLGRTLLTVFGTQQILAFGKASVKAFAEDEKAAKRLTQTLNNLNIGFEDPRISAFIRTLELQSGVLDDKLRPAMESLLRTTGSVTNSQKLLALAIDVSRGSGQDLEVVAQDLAKAYVGNTRGLIKYNIGLTKAEMAGKSFAEIQELLASFYSGSSAAYLNTYAGKVDQLRVAYANMQETIGKGLVDAFSQLSGNNGIAGASYAMETFGTNVSYALGGLSYYIKTVTDQLNQLGLLPIMQFFMKNMGIFSLLSGLIAKGKSIANAPQPFTTPMTISGQTDFYKQQDKARAAAEAAAAKRAKELDALRKKQETERLKREKLLAAQKRAQTIFDMENIQIVAAMQGKIDGEQRLRLTAMLALNTENYVAAEKLSDIIIRLNAPALSNLGVLIAAGDTIDDVIKKLITSQAKLAGLQLMAEDFPIPENIFGQWEDSLENILEMLKELLELLGGGKKSKAIKAPVKMGAVQRGEYAGDPYIPFGSGGAQILPYTDTTGIGLGSAARGEYSSYTSGTSGGSTSIVVNVSGNVISEQDLVSAITDQIYINQKSGTQIVFDSTAI